LVAVLVGLAKPLQYTSSTSEAAKFLGEQTGMSPIQIDNLVRGYTGTMGMYAMNMLVFSESKERKQPTP
jgi:hypothetical protein